MKGDSHSLHICMCWLLCQDPQWMRHHIHPCSCFPLGLALENIFPYFDWRRSIAARKTPMNYNIDDFSDEQKRFLSAIVSDFGGPTSTAAVLSILEHVLGECLPDWVLDPQPMSEDLRKDVEVCMAALNYSKVQSLAAA